MVRDLARLTLWVATACTLAAIAPARASAGGTLWFHACGDGQVNVVNWYLPSLGFSEGTQCPYNQNIGSEPGQHGIWLTSNGNAPPGYVARWEADPPPNIDLIAGQAPTFEWYSYSPTTSAFFYWQTGNSGYLTNEPSSQSGQLYTFPPSRYFGWELACNAQVVCGKPAYIDVNTLTLEGQETTSPALHPDFTSNLWYQSRHWIRGSFPIQFDAEDDSGVCQAVLTWDGQARPSSPTTPNSDYWNQCDPGAAPSATQYFFAGDSIDTTAIAPESEANVPLQLQATNAAQNTTTDTESLNIDNVAPQLTLSGPTQASATAGPQTVMATASAGPSGVGAITCRVDGGPPIVRTASAGAESTAATIPVTGLGQHQISCSATNRSYDAAGSPAQTPTRIWSLRIAEPVNGAITLGRVIRHCSRERHRVALPGHRHTRIERLLVCHAVGRSKRSARVAFGRRVAVSGWFTTTSDRAGLAHARVRVQTAADNGRHAWHTVKTVSTSKDGGWRATLPAGPSRLIRAVYAGGNETESANSPTARVLVPARVEIDIRPTHVQWGGVILISGRLLGGYVPKHSQVLQLRVGIGHIGSVQGNPSIDPRTGRFRFIWQFHSGTGTLNPWFAVATLREADYPFMPGVSRQVVVSLS
jgi:hypothetical protein